jgi:hypothetical protein
MSNFLLPRLRLVGAMALTLMVATACGGGGSSSDSEVGTGATGFVSGTVTKGPVGNATVTAYGIDGGQAGAQIGTTTTDADGNFNMAIGTYAGPVMLQVSGGSYTDEASGTRMAMAKGDAMLVVMPTVAAGTTVSGIQVTPVTTMAQSRAQHMTGGMTDTNIAAANSAMGNYFQIGDILHVQPMNPLVAGSGAGASQDAKNYGMTLAAMSEYAKDLGMASSSAIVTAMMSDAGDGVMDGMMGGNQLSMPMGGMMGGGMMASTAGTSGLSTAMTTFMNSATNASGMKPADMATLIHKLATSNGHL